MEHLNVPTLAFFPVAMAARMNLLAGAGDFGLWESEEWNSRIQDCGVLSVFRNSHDGQDFRKSLLLRLAKSSDSNKEVFGHHGLMSGARVVWAWSWHECAVDQMDVIMVWAWMTHRVRGRVSGGVRVGCLTTD